MKSNKGITIISLLIYLIVLTIVIGTISTLMRYFYNNEKESYIAENSSGQYARLIAYITDDVNSGKITNVEVSTSDIQLTYNDNSIHQYQYIDGKIYNIIGTNKKIEICSDVTSALFEYDSTNNKITINITMNGNVYVDVFTVK